MPEGDTLVRTAAALREVLRGRRVTAARGRPDGAALGRVVGSQVARVEARGKHLLIDFDNGLTLHTHLRMHGSWHRYRVDEPWRRSASRAVAVIEVPGAVAVCFDAPTVELLDSRAVAIHPTLRALGPDLLADVPDLDAAVGRLRDPSRGAMTVAEALLDQTAMAGLGNVYRSEVLFMERVDPFASLGSLPPETLGRLAATGASALRQNVDSPVRRTIPERARLAGSCVRSTGGPRLWVYGRTGRPCLVCGTPIRSTSLGDLPRRLYWCPACQPSAAKILVPAGEAVR
jgi:endonuclease VIII